MDAEPYDVTEQVGHLLRKAYQRHLAIFQANASDPQITSTQFVTLCALHDGGASTQSELTRITGIDQATIRGIITRLKRRGLVTDQPDGSDRRKVVIALTPRGAAVLEQMIPSARRITELTYGTLNAAERLALGLTLRKMIEQG